MGELLDRVDSRELSEWMAYQEIEPFPQERHVLLLATIAAILANANQDPETATTFEPMDFMPWLKGNDDNEDDDNEDEPGHPMLELVEAINAAFGGLDLRESGGT